MMTNETKWDQSPSENNPSTPRHDHNHPTLLPNHVTATKEEENQFPTIAVGMKHDPLYSPRTNVTTNATDADSFYDCRHCGKRHFLVACDDNVDEHDAFVQYKREKTIQLFGILWSYD
jgi:hypothetical protein